MSATATRSECPCPSCGRFTTARHTIGESGRRECPNRHCGTLFDVEVER